MEKTPEVIKKKHNYGWVLVWFFLFGAVVAYLDRVSLSYAATSMQKELAISATKMGVLLSAFQLPYAIANLPAGKLVDKFGAKRVFFISTLLWALSAMCVGISQGFYSLYGSRMLLGIAESPFFICGTRVVMDWFNEKERGLPISIFNSGGQIANIIGGPIMTTLLVYIGWRWTFIGLGIVGLIVPFIWLRVHRERRDVSVEEGGTDEPEEESTVKISILKLFVQRSTIGMMLGNFCVTYTVWVLLTWLPTYLEEERGLSMMKVGFVSMIPYPGLFTSVFGT
ncbi:MFS transporter [Lacticaseibacillus sp. GG6-2]